MHHQQYEEVLESRKTEPLSRKPSSRLVSREKYDKLKYKTREWYEHANSYREKNDKLVDTNEALERANEKLQFKNKEVGERLTKALSEVDRWKKCSENLPDPDFAEDLETENKELRKEVRSFKKKIKELQEKYDSKVTVLERELMLKDGKIQTLEETKKDLKERYKDLKDDLREYQRWSRGGHGNARE